MMPEIIEVKPGIRFVKPILLEILPDTETVLFFAKVYDLDVVQLSHLMAVTHKSTVANALLKNGGEHSTELQSYLLELGYEYLINEGQIRFDTAAAPPAGEILPEVWKSLQVEIAKSIKDVAAKLKDVVAHMPGKEGQMVFKSMMMVNAKRPILGDYRATITHARQPDNLVVLDVSGSMSARTIREIITDVVALSYLANAHLAIVSDTATVWGPGEYDVDTVLAAAEYSGTHYEALVGLFDGKDWGVVVAIADYDSSNAAHEAFKQVRGSIEQLFDISLVNRQTYLSEVLSLLAKDVRPLLMAADNYCCM
jgi:hypothetical protein